MPGCTISDSVLRLQNPTLSHDVLQEVFGLRVVGGWSSRIFDAQFQILLTSEHVVKFGEVPFGDLHESEPTMGAVTTHNQLCTYDSMHWTQLEWKTRDSRPGG